MAVKNKLIDLNNHLFEQLERLNDEDLVGEELDQEIKRSKAIASISKTIINNANLALEAKKHFDEYGIDRKEQPLVFIGYDGKD